MPLFTFDLHVLGTPPAFVLSQDQTLHLILSPPRLKGGHKYENALALPSQPDFQRADDLCFVVERVGRLSISQAPVKFFFFNPVLFAAGCFRFRLAPRTWEGFIGGAPSARKFFLRPSSLFSPAGSGSRWRSRGCLRIAAPGGPASLYRRGEQRRGCLQFGVHLDSERAT